MSDLNKVLRWPGAGCVGAVSSLFLAALMPSQVLAHNSIPDKQGVSASLSLAVSWRSQNQLSDDDIDDKVVWQVPGMMMGGHASAYEQYSTLDESSLRLQYLSAEGSYAFVKLGSHSGADPEIEEAFVGQQWQQDVHAEAGRMTAFFSPNNHLHPSTGLFSLSPLGFTAMFGGHIEDTGMRITAGNQAEGFSGGVENYRGSSFPAAGTGGLTALFLRHAHQGFSLDWQLQGWALSASAENRQDDRSSISGHSHSSSASSAFAGYFDGDTDAAGLFVDIGWTLDYQQRIGMRAEYMVSQVDGTVRDANDTQQIDLDGEYRGLLLEPEIRLGDHAMALRYERISISNTLTGSAVATLGGDAGLINNGHNPQRLTFAWNWQYNRNLGLRLEWMKDQALEDRQPEVFTTGVVWKTDLL